MKLACVAALFAAVALALGSLQPAHAVEAISVRLDAAAIDLTAAVERHRTEGDRILVSTAPGPDGIVQRMDVRAREGNTNWAVFALANSGNDQIDRLIVIPHYRLVGSGLLWPDLGLSRVVTITSSGDRPERQESSTADVYRITLDPGAVMTYVVELRTGKLTQIYLWEPDSYKDKLNSITLYYGIVIGIAGLLALFLTILFVVKGSVMFPAAAALGWAVLVYIGIDFGFWGKVFDMSAGSEQVWRASGEAVLAGTLLVFLFAYLNLNRWHVRYSHITIGWLAILGLLIALALVDASIASGIARISLLAVAVLGFGLVIYLSTHGFDRAVLLIPTWLLLVVWVFAAGAAVTGYVTNDIVGPALLGGLVLIVMLIGFTVMQHAFAGGVTTGIVSDVERRALALTGAGDMIWDWDVSADKIFTSPETESFAGTSSAARWRVLRRAGLKSYTPLIATASAPRSTACWNSAAAACSRNSGSAPPTAITCGSRSKRARWWARTVRWYGSSARSPTSLNSRTPRSGSCTTPCTTTSLACPTANCSSTGWSPCSRYRRSIRQSARPWW